ncbi:40-residue YVTN family beta-propeller repeat-containing protein [Thiothrix caldifontis]|uniref:40-residue YVTN family beta-propeller repeat-containing protein n=1 Tax=Thiothrix caldifontis TaxID=525918 RepID=A0A1H4F3F4_9GAMM|nr:hypothetical protein [Thiothrix caldifontis]SEA91437.1 40-residue YVTN family beta-propeller repeat-containing protein [Thiothrix caldifontis]
MFYFLKTIREVNRYIVFSVMGLVLIGCAAALVGVVASSSGVVTGAGAVLATNQLKVLPAAILPFTSELNRAVIAPDGSRLYAVDRLHNTLNVYDTASRKLIKVIDIPEIVDNRWGNQFANRLIVANLAISSDGTKLYITCPGVQQLVVIDTATLSIVKTVPDIGVNPVSISVSASNNQIYIASEGFIPGVDTGGSPSTIPEKNGNVVIVDSNTWQLTNLSTLVNEVTSEPAITFKHPSSLAPSPDGKYLYVTDKGNNALFRINLANGQGRKISDESQPSHVAVTPSEVGLILVSNSGDGTVSVINSQSLGRKLLSDTGISPTKEKPGFIAISPDGKWAFVANIGKSDGSISDSTQRECANAGLSRSVSVIDLKTQQVLAGSPLTVDAEIAGMAIYGHQNDKSKNEFDIQKAYLAATCPNGDLRDDNSINRMSEIDITLLASNPGQAVTPIEIPSKKSAFAIAVKPDGSEVYVVHADAITVIDANSRQKSASIAARGSGPFDLDVANDVLVTTNTGANSASFVDTSTWTPLTTIRSLLAPASVVAASNGQAYVANTGTFQTPGKSISVIGLRTGVQERELTTASLTAPFSLAVTPNGTSLIAGYAGGFTDYLPFTPQSGISLFGATSSTGLRIPPPNFGYEESTRIIAPSNNFIFATSYGAINNSSRNEMLYSNINETAPTSVSLFGSTDLNEKQPLPIDIEYFPIEATPTEAAKGKVAVLDYLGKPTGTYPDDIYSGASVSVFDVTLGTDGKITKVELAAFVGGKPNPVLVGNHAASSMLLAADDAKGTNLRAFVVNSGDKQFSRCTDTDKKVKSCGTGNSVTVVDMTTGTVNKIIERIGDKPMDIVQANGKAYVPAYFSNHVAVINLASETVERTIPVGNGPVKVTADQGKVYVANSIDGTVTVIDALTDQVIQPALAVNP